MKSSGIGGQAVLEGVMMRNKSEYAVAVRKPDGEIAVTHGKTKSVSDRSLFFRLPIIRGIVAFAESLVLGMRTLTYSASFYEEEEEKIVSKKKEDTKDDRKEAIQMGLTVALSVVIAVLAFVVLPYGLSQMLSSKIDSFAVLGLIEGLIRIVLFVGYVIAISYMKDINRTFMYHGAEHKAINCIENGLELSAENVRKQSRYHKRCGTNFLFIVIFLSIIFFMFIHFENMWIRMLSRIVLVPVIAGVSFEFIRLAGNSENKIVGILCKPGMLLQMLTTREPDNKMIEVAITSVEEVFDWKEYQRRCIAAKKSRAKLQEIQGTEKKRKSRAELAEEIKRREAENAKRANERAKYIMERERKEAELERIAEEAAKRASKREEMLKDQEDDETLNNLDHFFDDSEDKKEEK